MMQSHLTQMSEFKLPDRANALAGSLILGQLIDRQKALKPIQIRFLNVLGIDARIAPVKVHVAGDAINVAAF